MGSCVTKNQQGYNKYRDVPRCAPDTYPKNPAYANSAYSGVSGPAVVMPVGGHQGNMNAGDMLVAGAIMNQQGGGILGPEMYNPMSGGYSAL